METGGGCTSALAFLLAAHTWQYGAVHRSPPRNRCARLAYFFVHAIRFDQSVCFHAVRLVWCRGLHVGVGCDGEHDLEYYEIVYLGRLHPPKEPAGRDHRSHRTPP